MLAVRSISFTEEYKEELDFFKSQSNKSKYICELIRKDRLGNGGLNKEFIEKLIDEKLKKIPIVKDRDECINNQVKDNLRGLFGNF